MIESIDYGTQTIEFEVQRKKACKNTYITVERDIGVVVKTNIDISIEELKTLVKSKAKWILKKFEEIGQSIDYGKIVTGSRLFYMGKSYYIELLKEDRMNYEIEFIHSKFIIKTPPNAEQKKLNEIIEEFYKQKRSTGTMLRIPALTTIVTSRATIISMIKPKSATNSPNFGRMILPFVRLTGTRCTKLIIPKTQPVKQLHILWKIVVLTRKTLV